MQASSSIDLVKNKSNIIDEIVKWTLNFGRLLIIIVEIVAFSSFIYRFYLDRTLIDLNDKIKQEQAIIESTKDREAIYRNLQERLAIAKNVSAQGGTNLKILNDIIFLPPSQIKFNSISIENGEIIIYCNVNSVSSLTLFINALKEYPQINLVTVKGIENQPQTNSVDVFISAKLKEGINEESL